MKAVKSELQKGHHRARALRDRMVKPLAPHGQNHTQHRDRAARNRPPLDWGAPSRSSASRPQHGEAVGPTHALEIYVGCPHCAHPVDISAQLARAVSDVAFAIFSMLECDLSKEDMRARLERLIAEARADEEIARAAREQN